ncbi:nitroreductase family protein [Aetokthonos hydrillicola Thurmond2011]|jgi:nitroreductase|uniref:Nitroreductase family protein n=1 Tax=Aetokthonos hydrillicola Thurmond2011 TaxID=2712845 RepID=A0AAP5IAQ9_9CYAN|nr:nitroreductase family protein [Aetokthonos hydrillicola]MBO3458842.1 nitroreductase family protein [Aetokthonos hydrillicola CCALA 1050]MBW4587310.1 nitroreductase family protein [Aetokthonos hydrillicola CCALA 1050]MDR9896667.1 nitroreductase family protein [Aetokthonos hydrillicola Thurmond2011]
MHNVDHSVVNKSADTQYPVHDLISKRWSPLAFSERLVEQEKLLSVLEAARWAASSYNEQPWSYIVATRDNQAEFDLLLSCLAEGNQPWAKNAPVLMLSVAKLNFERNGVENRHALHDVGAASAQLAIQATSLGLFIHQMAGFNVPRAKEVYNIPQVYEPVAAIALGYLGNPETLTEKYLERERSPRNRKSLESFVFSGKWNQTSPLIIS